MVKWCCAIVSGLKIVNLGGVVSPKFEKRCWIWILRRGATVCIRRRNFIFVIIVSKQYKRIKQSTGLIKNFHKLKILHLSYWCASHSGYWNHTIVGCIADVLEEHNTCTSGAKRTQTTRSPKCRLRGPTSPATNAESIIDINIKRWLKFKISNDNNNDRTDFIQLIIIKVQTK
jgi:hypothetical protein